MTTWGNSEVLIDMLQRQLRFLQTRDSERIIPAAGRWLGFLRREPQLAELLKELAEETRGALRHLTEVDHEIRDLLLMAWKENEALLRACLVEESDKEQLHAYGHMDRFKEAVSERPAVTLPRWRTFDEDTTDTENHVLAMKHWTSWAISCAERRGGRVDEALIGLRDRLNEASLAVQFGKRRLRIVFEGSPGAALYRIRSTVREATPMPPQRSEHADEEEAEAHAWEIAIFERTNEFAEKVHSRRALATRHLEADEVTAAGATIAADAELITNELQMRILAGRSRLALVRRYAAQCEGFDADTLRKRLRSGRGKVERELTLDFAKYLFQQGLTPILDATIGSLRPDVLDAAPSGLLYVEAKQYSDKAPRSKITAAYRQVWSTWGRLANVYNVPEAFLLVFRVGGPRVELPPVLRHHGRILYSVLVDVSASAGSRERAALVSFAPAELQPG